MRLADLKRLADARAAAEMLWPAYPKKIAAMEAWLTDQAFPLCKRLETQHRPTLAVLRLGALAYDSEQEQNDRQMHPRAGELAKKSERLEELREQLAKASANKNPGAEGQDDSDSESESEPQDGAAKIPSLEKLIAQTEQRIAELQGLVSERRTWLFTDDWSQWQHDTLAGLVADLEKFADADPKAGTLASVQVRLDFARTVNERSVTGKEVAASGPRPTTTTPGWTSTAACSLRRRSGSCLWAATRAPASGSSGTCRAGRVRCATPT